MKTVLGAALGIAALINGSLCFAQIAAETPVPPTADATPVTAAAPIAASDLAATFSGGVALLQDGRAAEALEIFERVRRARETPAVLYNIALARRALGQFVESARAIDLYLAAAGDRIDATRRREVDALAAEVRRSIARVPIVIDGVGATLRIDGDATPRERLGAPVALDPGRHTFRVEGDELRPQEITRLIVPGDNPTVRLTPVRIRVVTALGVVASVSTAEILVDQILVGSGSYESSVRPGRHDVVVRAHGYQPYSTTVVMPGGTVTNLRPTLSREVQIYSRWWLWTGTGALSVATTVAALVVALSGVADPFTGSLGWSYAAVTRPREER